MSSKLDTGYKEYVIQAEVTSHFSQYITVYKIFNFFRTLSLTEGQEKQKFRKLMKVKFLKICFSVSRIPNKDHRKFLGSSWKFLD